MDVDFFWNTGSLLSFFKAVCTVFTAFFCSTIRAWTVWHPSQMFDSSWFTKVLKFIRRQRYSIVGHLSWNWIESRNILPQFLDCFFESQSATIKGFNPFAVVAINHQEEIRSAEGKMVHVYSVSWCRSQSSWWDRIASFRGLRYRYPNMTTRNMIGPHFSFSR